MSQAIDQVQIAKLNVIIQNKWKPGWTIRGHRILKNKYGKWIAVQHGQKYGKYLAKAELDAYGPERLIQTYGAEYRQKYNEDLKAIGKPENTGLSLKEKAIDTVHKSADDLLKKNIGHRPYNQKAKDWAEGAAKEYLESKKSSTQNPPVLRPPPQSTTRNPPVLKPPPTQHKHKPEVLDSSNEPPSVYHREKPIEKVTGKTEGSGEIKVSGGKGQGKIPFSPAKKIKANERGGGHINSSTNSSTDSPVRKEPKKVPGRDMSSSSTKKDDTQVDQEMEVQLSSSGMTNALGHRGSFVGTTQRSVGYEEYRYERNDFYSIKRKDMTIYWSMSSDEPGYDYGIPTVAPHMVGTFRSGLVFQKIVNKVMQYPYGHDSLVSLSGLVNAVPLNFLLWDFFDDKLLTSNGGKLREYKKLSLLKIHVDITISTQHTSAFNNAYYITTWKEHPLDPPVDMNASYDLSKYPNKSWDPKYLIFRDVYGDYLNSDNIIPLSSDEFNGGTNKPPRNVQKLQQEDHTISVVGNKFTFTKEVQAGGPYFITPANIWASRERTISNIINEIEGQSSAGSGMLSRFPEFFSFLIAPLNAPIASMDNGQAGNRYTTFTPNIYTQLHVKTRGEWLGIDYQGGTFTIPTTLKSDPYFQSESNFNAELSHQFSTH